jgi:transcriptional regulator with XRE-family HTH domain
MIEMGIHLQAARIRRGYTQEQLARAAGLHQSLISAIENGKRLPAILQLLRLAGVLKVPLQQFLTGTDTAGTDLGDISFQLQTLGIADLDVRDEHVPGAFRHDEEIMALALAPSAPESRIVEAMPTVLAWNAKNTYHLQQFAEMYGEWVKIRLGWLADIAITIHQTQGFPGGCPYFLNLQEFIKRIGEPSDGLDSLGFRGDLGERPPVTLRWKMGYPAPLSTFRERAERLYALRMKQHFGIVNSQKTE